MLCMNRDAKRIFGTRTNSSLTTTTAICIMETGFWQGHCKIPEVISNNL